MGRDRGRGRRLLDKRIARQTDFLVVARCEEALGKCISKVIQRKWNRFVQLPFPLRATTTTNNERERMAAMFTTPSELRRIRTRFWFWFVCETQSHSALHIAWECIRLEYLSFLAQLKLHTHTQKMDGRNFPIPIHVGGGGGTRPYHQHPVYCWCSHKTQKLHTFCINKQISEIKNIRNDLKTQLNAHCRAWECVCECVCVSLCMCIALLSYLYLGFSLTFISSCLQGDWEHVYVVVCFNACWG